MTRCAPWSPQTDEFPPPQPFQMKRRPRGPMGSAGAGRRWRRALIRPLLAALLIITLVLWAFDGAFHAVHGSPASTGAPSGAPTAEVSTPRSQWARGELPYLFQADPEWGSRAYAGGTMASHGCGPTCLSMAYVALTGKTDRDPAAMAAFSEEGGYVDQGLTSWLLMGDGARSLGLESQEIPADEGRILEALSQGHPVIASLGPGDFTSDGHFIVLGSADEEGRVEVRDPNSARRSRQLWSLERLLPQCRNLWELSYGKSAA